MYSNPLFLMCTHTFFVNNLFRFNDRKVCTESLVKHSNNMFLFNYDIPRSATGTLVVYTYMEVYVEIKRPWNGAESSPSKSTCIVGHCQHKLPVGSKRLVNYKLVCG